MYVLTEIRHNILMQCLGDYIEAIVLWFLRVCMSKWHPDALLSKTMINKLKSIFPIVKEFPNEDLEIYMRHGRLYVWSVHWRLYLYKYIVSYLYSKIISIFSFVHWRLYRSISQYLVHASRKFKILCRSLNQFCEKTRVFKPHRRHQSTFIFFLAFI